MSEKQSQINARTADGYEIFLTPQDRDRIVLSLVNEIETCLSLIQEPDQIPETLESRQKYLNALEQLYYCLTNLVVPNKKEPDCG